MTGFVLFRILEPIDDVRSHFSTILSTRVGSYGPLTPQ